MSATVLFALSKILWWVARPSFLLIVLIVIGLAAHLLWRARWGRRLAWLAGLVLVVCAVLPIGSWLMSPLENRFPPVETPPAQVDGIIVLGGAIEPVLTALHGAPALNDAAERMTTFVALARRYPNAKLIFTGGSGSLLFGDFREADVAKRLFADLGLDTDRVTFDRESRNTYENAVFTKQLMAPAPGQTWVLITSAFHMPRAMGIFRRVGWTVLPWPVGNKSGIEEYADPGYSLSALDGAVHEWLGLVAYRLLGRTNALFPRP